MALTAPATWIPSATERTAAILGGLIGDSHVTANLAPDAMLAALAIENGLTIISADHRLRPLQRTPLGEPPRPLIREGLPVAPSVCWPSVPCAECTVVAAAWPVAWTHDGSNLLGNDL